MSSSLSRLFFVLLTLLLPSCCWAFQMRHPAQRNILTFTRFVSPRNTAASSDDLDGIREESSEVYEIDNYQSYSSPPPQPIRKFTGAPQSSLFTYRSEQSSSSPSTNLLREREREFNLASNFERTFGIQAVLLLAAFIYMASVGLSGGITDGSDRNFYGEDEVDGVVMEQLERMRTDDAAEVLSRASAMTTVRI
jgi:hypothetical protein